MAARTALSLLAVVVIAWTAVLLRDFSIGDPAAKRSFFVRDASAQQRADDRRALADAQLLDPSHYWDGAHAYNLLVSGDRAAAAREAEALVRAEPESNGAWNLLVATTRDPARRAQARARLRELDPLGSR